MVPIDTSAEAARIQIEIFRRQQPERRLRAALDMSQLARELIKRGIRLRHPQYDERQVHLALCKTLLPPELFKGAYPGAEDVRP